jgi:hypothetical protein
MDLFKTEEKKAPGMDDLLSEFAIEHHNQPEGWRVFMMSVAEEDAPKEFMLVEGAIAPNKKNSKEANWKKLDKSTKKRIFINEAAFSDWKNERGRKLDQCIHCWGTKRLIRGWNKVDGNQYVPCHHCKETGMYQKTP